MDLEFKLTVEAISTFFLTIISKAAFLGQKLSGGVGTAIGPYWNHNQPVGINTS